MIIDWTDQEIDWIEQWCEMKPGLPIKRDCPPDIRKSLEEKMEWLDMEKTEREDESLETRREGAATKQWKQNRMH